ncbi:MAG TPA: hypothetical protein DCX50_09815 [Limnobacter sp.]|nr:hypothetical protein [Limnobacter sp.]
MRGVGQNNLPAKAGCWLNNASIAGIQSFHTMALGQSIAAHSMLSCSANTELEASQGALYKCNTSPFSMHTAAMQ